MRCDMCCGIVLQCCGTNSTSAVHSSVMSKLLFLNPPELWNGMTDSHDNDEDNYYQLLIVYIFTEALYGVLHFIGKTNTF